MDRKAVKRVIESAEYELDRKGAYVGIFKNESEQGHSFIKANRKGLYVFASELLKVATEDELLNQSSELVVLDSFHEFYDEQSDTQIEYIEYLDHDVTFPEEPKQKLLKVGLVVVLFFLAICAITGFVFIINELFFA